MIEFTYPELVKEIHTKGRYIWGSKTTKELTNISLKVDSNNFFSCYPIRPFDTVKRYLFGELAWYLSGQQNVNYIKKYSVFWEKLTNSDGTVNSNYGNLVFYKKIKSKFYKNKYTMFSWCVKELKKDVNSRKAVVLYNSDDYYFDSNKDFICTQLQHFLIRGNELQCIVYIRSSDLILGLTYDIPWWSIVHQMLYLKLKKKYKDLRLGNINIKIGSSHIYIEKLALTQNMINRPIQQAKIILTKEIPLGNTAEWYENNLFKYISIVSNKKDLKLC
jgi:thymidylate synthase